MKAFSSVQLMLVLFIVSSKGHNMEFTSFISLTPFDEHLCNVEAIYLPGDPDVGVADDWDLFVFVEGVDVTYDISSNDRERLIEEAKQHAKNLAGDAMIDQYEYNRSFDL